MLQLPNQAPYQLGHTRIFDSSFARSGQTCGQIPLLTAPGRFQTGISLSATTVFLRPGETPHFPCSSSQTRRPTNWATPGYLLLLFAQSGQTCGQIPFSTAQSGLSVEIFLSAATAFLLSRETQHFPCSSSQIKRPTNWATPGYLILLLPEVVKHVVKFHFLPPRAGSKLEFPLVPQQFFCARGRLRTSRAPAPKPGALPTGPHPDIYFFFSCEAYGRYSIPSRADCQREFLPEAQLLPKYYISFSGKTQQATCIFSCFQ